MMKFGLRFKISAFIKLGVRGGKDFVNDLNTYLLKDERNNKVEKKRIRISLNKLGNISLNYRSNTSDVFWIAEILISKRNAFLKGVYDNCRIPPVDYVLDLGANIGTFSLYMKNLYPNVNVVAVEPETENCTLLKENIGMLGGIEIVRGGIWNRKIFLRINNPNSDKDGFICEEIDVLGDESERELIKAVDIDSLFEDYKIEGRILIKMDIEGAEKQVFENISECEWIDKVDILIIEIHDMLHPNLSSKIITILRDKGFYCSKVSDNYFCTRKRPMFPQDMRMLKDRLLHHI